MNEIAISTDKLTRKFGALTAVDAVDLRIVEPDVRAAATAADGHHATVGELEEAAFVGARADR